MTWENCGAGQVRLTPIPQASTRFAQTNRKEPCGDYRTGYPSVCKPLRRVVSHPSVGCLVTWFKVDDSFYDHPKIFDAPDCAVALWTRAGTWSARNLTDGFVPAGMPARLCDDPDTAVRQLMTRGLWNRTKGGYQFHDWAEYQPSAEAVKKLRETRAEAGKRGGQAKAAKQTASKSLASASPVAKQNAAPTRPVPKGRGGTGDLQGDRSVTRAIGDPPSVRCEKHRETDGSEPCGACGDARRARTRWDIAEAERIRNAPKCRSHRGQLADNCALCRSEALADEEDL